MRGLKAPSSSWLTPKLYRPTAGKAWSDTGINTAEALDNVELDITCDADATTAIPIGSIIQVESEVMTVTATGLTLTVVRPNPVSHLTNIDIYKVINTSCVLWLPGQDDPQSATIRDRSGKGNHGTITGATWVRNSKGLWYLDFDGDDNLNCGDITQLNSVAVFHISFWIRPDVLNALRNWFAKLGVGQYNVVLYTYGGTTLLYYDVRNGVSASGSFDYNGVLSTGNSYKINAVFNGAGATNADKAKLYINAVQRTLSLSGTFPTTTADLSGKNLVWGNNLDGGMALETIRNAVPSQSLITQEYNQERYLFGV